MCQGSNGVWEEFSHFGPAADLGGFVAALAQPLQGGDDVGYGVGLELLGGIRNLNASRIAVLADLTACEWKETDFFALALQNNERFQRDEQILTLFTYDLREYKQVPDWLNARFWANPENFGKYWW